jgi:hypothetical protein
MWGEKKEKSCLVLLLQHDKTKRWPVALRCENLSFWLVPRCLSTLQDDVYQFCNGLQTLARDSFGYMYFNVITGTERGHHAIIDVAACNNCKNVLKTIRILAQGFQSILFLGQGHSVPKERSQLILISSLFALQAYLGWERIRQGKSGPNSFYSFIHLVRSYSLRELACLQIFSLLLINITARMATKGSMRVIFQPMSVSEEPVCILSLSAKSSFYLPAFQISHSCRTVDVKRVSERFSTPDPS